MLKRCFTKNQAKVISLAVRESYNVVDIATKRDLGDVHKEIDSRFDRIDDVCFWKIEKSNS
ncbi:MAG: hypothetical protein ACTS73_07865 [Arsenophonus sp. NEOnobi-MAG3]